MKGFLVLLLAVAAVFAGYRYWYAPLAADADPQEEAVAVVTSFGRVLQMVPLSGDPEAARQAMAAHYAPYVSELLLAEWKDDPRRAPGRLTSSPWPARIEPETLAEAAGGGYVVEGRVIEITSKELVEGGSAREYAVRAVVEELEEGWRITEFARL